MTGWILLVTMLICVLTSVMLSALRNYSLSRLLERMRDRSEVDKERYRKYSDVEERSILSCLLLRGMGIVGAILALFHQRIPDHLVLPVDFSDLFSLWQLAGVALEAFVLVICAGCILPELWAAHFAEAIVLRGMPIMQGVVWVLRPLTYLAELLDVIGKRLLGAEDIPEEDQVEDEILDGLTSGERARLVDPEQTEMIRSIFDLGDTDVRDIMTPRTDVVMIHVDTPLMEAVEQAIECGHSRIPVFGENRDEIVGILYAKDLLKTWAAGQKAEDDGGRVGTPTLRDHLRKTFFVPEHRHIGELLAEMRSRRVHLGVILDEYGGCAGLVTIEDIVEEIVGDIQDEHDDEDEPEELIKTSEGVLECSGQAHIEELEDALGVKLEEVGGDLDTVGGYVFARLGHIPEEKSQHVLSNLRFSVLSSDERRINRLRVEVLPQDATLGT